VLLLPFQVGVLGTPSPSVTPTNLLYNVVATPGALYRFWRQGQTGGRLTRLLVWAPCQGSSSAQSSVWISAGAVAFDVVIAAVLIPLGGWLILDRQSARKNGSTVGDSHRYCCGHRGCRGRYLRDRWRVDPWRHCSSDQGARPSDCGPCHAGIDLRHICGRSATFLRSQRITTAPSHLTGESGSPLGVGGLVGGYTGARLQPRLPESLIRRLLGLLVLAIGIRYAWLAAT